MYVGDKTKRDRCDIELLNRTSSHPILKNLNPFAFLSYAYFPVVITKKGCPIGHL